ncbi:uncharacterized protein DDB_G0284459 [Episyrphus balteatus]|uniref:uncharacterized protein DDB_G0284459 n=1 Tax=Episyrphus balteatus TaxID=286459 RepID=UPI002485AFFC|nr:uncharacterized protein DDB_G0284459 [Episyrphus balteatus]XP_055845738.1 uncharacterized protein DDB_G0284459 [Episyrphus balteatus]XP_055845739.1 uncharacterized protein DDB_G0284459 [Episyrphus balteatus]XP_055845740.1 uncharacterized protein DDB_G0284459 [Episyrphus balteatus]XP_055845741.1 uncharacterized protein DDB_G0284459 [Episyrphus balteatus]XP_055845742.1 uncharacterized protein DDB_G0284459 [Episyrphus balteatus]XP_055845743.1 uncharacterized protein DDB_G0284459 [Episyrphus b
MLIQGILLQVITFALLLCITSSHPAIQKDSTNLQSIEYSTDRKRPTLPDAAATIEQVQKILQADPSLPRLTKGEIQDLFEQVTREEYEKSVQLGDAQRADNMRALMLVLPFNTENTTDEVLQELYTRPPITKVIDTYSSPQPQTFQSSASTTSGKVEIVEIGNLAATTYKPYFRLKEKTNAKPTTYHPPKPIFKSQEPPVFHQLPNTEVPVTSLPLLPDIEEEEKKATRYSSSYNAKDPDWSLLEGEFTNRINFNQKFTPMPDLAGIFKTMGLDQTPKRFKVNEYQKVAKPSISSSIQQSSLGNIDITDFTRSLPPRPHLEAYSEFKPLNIGEEIRIKPDVEDYLNRFGIVNRKRKQIKPEDAGLKNDNKAVKVKEQAIRRIDTDVIEPEPSKNTDDQLSKLLSNLQELERLNVSLSSNMLKPAQPSNSSSQILGQGPDPITADEESRKNDSKRQSSSEQAASESDSKTESTEPDNVENDSETTSTTSSTQDEEKSSANEPQNGSLADLEDSFGGPDPVTEDPSPPPKKNGFYFLADWNSFLEVGEAGNDQVVVRFDPKIGDPRRFLKVTVP